jgi:hypothetical protein
MSQDIARYYSMTSGHLRSHISSTINDEIPVNTNHVIAYANAIVPVNISVLVHIIHCYVQCVSHVTIIMLICK